MKKISLSKFKDDLYKEFGEIRVYNLLAKQNFDMWQEVCLKVTSIMDKYNEEKKGNKDAVIDTYTLLLEILPIMTNLSFDDLTSEEVEDILARPTFELSQVITEIGDCINNIILPQIMKISQTLAENKETMIKYEKEYNKTNNKIRLLDERKEYEAKRNKKKREEIKDNIDELTKKIAELELKLSEI